LVAKVTRQVRVLQQSVLLLMLFGLAIWAMLEPSKWHIALIPIFTVCALALLRWGLPK
jgi:hypothetical protein